MLLVLFCFVLFIASFVAPRRSRGLQRLYDRVLRRAERKSDREAGRLGDLTEGSLRGVRRAGDRSTEGGRSLRRKLPR